MFVLQCKGNNKRFEHNDLKSVRERERESDRAKARMFRRKWRIIRFDNCIFVQKIVFRFEIIENTMQSYFVCAVENSIEFNTSIGRFLIALPNCFFFFIKWILLCNYDVDIMWHNSNNSIQIAKTQTNTSGFFYSLMNVDWATPLNVLKKFTIFYGIQYRFFKLIFRDPCVGRKKKLQFIWFNKFYFYYFLVHIDTIRHRCFFLQYLL